MRYAVNSGPTLNENAVVSERTCMLYVDYVNGADAAANLDFLLMNSGTLVLRASLHFSATN